MDKKSFLQAGHTPTLLAAFLYFDLAFMVWVILGPLGVGIANSNKSQRRCSAAATESGQLAVGSNSSGIGNWLRKKLT